MIYSRVRIDNFSCLMPEEIISSAQIEETLAPLYERLKLPAGRLELMTGIRERRAWTRGTLPSEAAVLAGEKALAASSVPRSKIGALMMCSVCRDCLEPATATIVHSRLGLPDDCVIFDISNACLGLLSGMITAANMIELGQIDSALLVAGENGRPLLEATIDKMLNDASLTRQTVKPLFASLTIGSGAAAVLMTSDRILPDGHRFIGGATLSDTAGNELCRGNSDRGMDESAAPIMNTDSEVLMKRGVALASGTWKKFKAELSMDEKDFDVICTHQVGVAHRKLLYESLGLDLAKDFSTFERYGNVGSVSCIATAAEAAEQNFLKKGQTLAILGIGSGINCTMLGVEW